jgi:hypothetical protein
MAVVFVGYAKKDDAAAAAIVDALLHNGMEASSADATEPLAAPRLQAAITSARCMIILWSDAAARSQFVQQEMQHLIKAWSSNRLLLAALDDTPLPIGLRDLAAIRINDASDSGARELVESARAIVSVPEPTLAPAAPKSRKLWAIVAAGIVVLGIASAFNLMWMWTAARAPSPGPVLIAAPLRTADLVRIAIELGLVPIAAVIAIIIMWRRIARAVATARHARRDAPSQPPPRAGKTPQVFISYSRQDGQAVDQLARQIEQLGYVIWIDRQSTGSQRYAAPIVRAIRTSRLVALMCSRNAFASDHVIREVYVAGDFKKPFIAFQLDPTDFPDEVLYFVSGFPRITVADMDAQQLHAEIARLVDA